MRSVTLILLALAALVLGLSAGAATLPAVAPVVDCASLRGFDPGLPGFPMEITDAAELDAGGRRVCRVRGSVSPQIRFEVRMPLGGWTQRYLQTGCGGLCGRLAIEAPQRACPELKRGDFATASTDMGHEGPGGTWGASDLQLRVDFAYRGVHATARVAQALIARFYGQPARRSYFSGCSDGGREALMEAQRYPEDFDGIAAGAPALNFLVQNSFHHAWEVASVMRGGRGPALKAADLPVLHAAALAACDAADGSRDGVISDPLNCRFDPHTARCGTGKAGACLSQEAVDAAAAIYAGAQDEDGHRLVVGGLLPGSELGWEGVFVPGIPTGMRPPFPMPGPGDVASPPPRLGPPPGGGLRGGALPAGLPPGLPPGPPGPPRLMSEMIASDALRSLAFPKPLPATWRLADFPFTAASLQALAPMHGLYDATDPDLGGFAARHGRLLMWHGLADPQISPANSIAYAEAVTDTMGTEAANDLMRLFLVPGMAHCGGGDGPTSIDVLTPLMAWVEDGRAPDALVASRSEADARAGRGHTLFPWPAAARLRAGADPDRPASWERSEPPTPSPKLYAGWLGASFFAPGYERDCGFDGESFACRPLARRQGG